jgi:hypothetical protein
MTRKPATQPSLFDAASDGAALVAIHRPTATLSKPQRLFNRLTAQIRRERELLAAWEAYLPRLQERVVNEMQPLETALRAAQRRLLDTIDALLTWPKPGERLRRRERVRLQALVAPLIEQLQAHDTDPELDAISERHGGMTRDERQQIDVKLAESMFGALFGDDVIDGHSASTLDELFTHVHEKADARAEAEARERAAQADARAAARRARRGRPSAAEQAAERRAQEASEASASVREIYRKLASSLHPDREPDPAERQRKTALMQRVNQAYARDDLLELLGLQMEIEQIDADHLAHASEARMRHYNHVLQEQLHALQCKVMEVAEPVQSGFDLAPRRVEPKFVDAEFSAQLAACRALCRQIERDLRHLADPQRRSAWIDALPDDDEDPFDALVADAKPRRRRR